MHSYSRLFFAYITLSVVHLLCSCVYQQLPRRYHGGLSPSMDVAGL